jgi:hypothetical protein
MSTWIDPEFGPALHHAALIAVAKVVQSSPAKSIVQIERVFAGREQAGSTVEIKRAAVVGRGQENNRLPLESFVFIVAADPLGGYVAVTDTYWYFRISDETYVHMPVRDPFTRAYVPFDDLIATAALLRDRQNSRRLPYLQELVARLAATPVQAKQPIEVNLQVFGHEILHLLAAPGEFVSEVKPFLDSPHFQVRWSAVRAMQSCGRGQPVAIPLLLQRLLQEGVPPVQAALGEALFEMVDSATYRPFIEKALPNLYANEAPYSQNIMNPVMNMMPSPKATAMAILLRLDGEQGDLTTLRQRAQQRMTK